MTLTEAVTVARKVLHGCRVYEQVTPTEVRQAYDTLAHWHIAIHDMETWVEKIKNLDQLERM